VTLPHRDAKLHDIDSDKEEDGIRNDEAFNPFYIMRMMWYMDAEWTIAHLPDIAYYNEAELTIQYVEDVLVQEQHRRVRLT
jgi:hypothetical protein